jgi:hypothetical protein
MLTTIKEEYRTALDPSKMSLDTLGTLPTSEFMVKGAQVRFVGTCEQLKEALKQQ